MILKQVDDNKFPVRAKGLAAEIVTKNPDLVGLQEVALWRTEPCTESPLPPHATQVRYDFLKLLLAAAQQGQEALSHGDLAARVRLRGLGEHRRQRVDRGPGMPDGQRDQRPPDDARRDPRPQRTRPDVQRPRAPTSTRCSRSGRAAWRLNVTRGWTRVDAKVPGAARFRFVNTHLEAFDNQASNHTNNGADVGNGQIREAQAKELFARGGPATGTLPVILVGDLNSDVKTEVKPGDGLAYRALLGAGFAERSTSHPLGCCLKRDVLTTSGGGKVSDFDHKVDHVMTNAPRKIKLVSSAVTGRQPVNGFWDSDHAGLFSRLSLP